MWDFFIVFTPLAVIAAIAVVGNMRAVDAAVLKERLDDVGGRELITVEYTEHTWPWSRLKIWPKKETYEVQYLYKYTYGMNVAEHSFVTYPEVEEVLDEALIDMMTAYNRGEGVYNQEHMRLRAAVDEELGVSGGLNTLLKKETVVAPIPVNTGYGRVYDALAEKYADNVLNKRKDEWKTAAKAMGEGVIQRIEKSLFQRPETVDEIRQRKGLPPWPPPPPEISKSSMLLPQGKALSKAALAQQKMRKQRENMVHYRAACGYTRNPEDLTYHGPNGEVITEEYIEATIIPGSGRDVLR